MAFPGMGGLGMGLGQQANLDANQLQQKKVEKFMQTGMESCLVKAALAGGMGYGLGGMFGIFMASMRYDTPLSAGLPGGVGTTLDMPVRKQVALGLKDMGRSAMSTAKNFGYIGLLFAGSECAIEGFRGKNDLTNGAAAGCFVGAFLAKSAGPQAMCVGCAGFAAFSTAIDYYMRMPSDDRAADPII